MVTPSKQKPICSSENLRMLRRVDPSSPPIASPCERLTPGGNLNHADDAGRAGLHRDLLASREIDRGSRHRLHDESLERDGSVLGLWGCERLGE